MITLIGVGHVFNISARLKCEITDRSPNLVCIELDRDRFQALLDRSQGKGQQGGPVLYQMMARFQQRIADQYGTAVGDEMLAAADAARSLHAGVAFIDLNSGQIFNEFWASMSFREKILLGIASFAGLFAGKKGVEKEVARFEENPQEYLDAFAVQFPSAKRVLIDKRNAHMAGRVRELSARFDRIVAVVGDGHVDGMGALLRDLNPGIVRLAQLRRPPDAVVKDGNGTYSYSFQ